ncbi:flavin-binding monooxygenase-like protein-like protein [Rhizodiscina lignyota]|uniref:Flavin-binding monooxygenase-like protein-like protein n=1 Tax=Rhizodiscina lignyota TaxID=1504668 RepID=A0A9P4IG64_9PEZI|nr:flavin-binding monooxygenase-like protein-like protein [Rhizodiscina lignyota]
MLMQDTGVYGLAAAKTYLEINPSADIIVLDGAKSIGGVWAAERLYPGLRSNNLLGTYEYSDFPMDEASFGVKPGHHIPGEVIHKYLNAYATKFNIARKVRLQSKVYVVQQDDNAGWILEVATQAGESSSDISKLHAKRLIVATGLASEPLRVSLPGMDDFGAPIFHSREFRAHSDMLKEAKVVTVLGGHKSAWDAAYEFAANGVQVEWVIRESGHGPIWSAPSHVTPLKMWLEKLIFTRLLTWFSPCIFANSYVRRFLHGTFVGRFFVDTFWKILESDLVQLNGYDEHPETKKLKPWNAAFWIGNGLSILNFPTSIFDMVKKGQIHVHVRDIVRLSEKHVHLSNGEILPSDAIICASGWKPQPSIEFLPTTLNARLGLPHTSDQKNDLAVAADRDILGRYPRLRNQPVLNPKYKPLTGDAEAQASINEPFRLYRFMVSPDPDFLKLHNIGFAGMIWTLSQTVCAQMQSLWLTAYLDGKLKIDQAPDQVLWEATLFSQFQKWRHPTGYGNMVPDLVFETLPYFDFIMDDLGLQVHRKKTTFAELFEGYGPEDYREIVKEWKEKNVYSSINIDYTH